MVLIYFHIFWFILSLLALYGPNGELLALWNHLERKDNSAYSYNLSCVDYVCCN